MLKKYFPRIIVIVIAFLKFDNAVAQQAITDYMNVPGPIVFDSTNFYLAWSSRPVDNYYKQEYLAKGDSLEHFAKLFLIDVLEEDSVKPQDLVYMKIKDLKERKKTDAVVNYNLIKSPDGSEYILDFTESEGMPKVAFVEWNAYLYKAIKTKSGHKAVLLYGISIRTYGNDVPDFFGRLDKVRESVVQQLMNYMEISPQTP